MLSTQKSNHRKYITQIPNISQKWFCIWHEHMDLNFQMNKKLIVYVPYLMNSKTKSVAFAKPPIF